MSIKTQIVIAMLVQMVYLDRGLFVETRYAQSASIRIYVIEASYSINQDEKIPIGRITLAVSGDEKIQIGENQILLNDAFFVAPGRMRINYLIREPGFGSLGTLPLVKQTDNNCEFSLSLDHFCDPKKPFEASIKYMNADSNLNFGVYFLVICTFKYDHSAYIKENEQKASMIKEGLQKNDFNIWDMEEEIDFEHLKMEFLIWEQVIINIKDGKSHLPYQVFKISGNGLEITNLFQKKKETNKTLNGQDPKFLKLENLIENFEETSTSCSKIDKKECHKKISEALNKGKLVITSEALKLEDTLAPLEAIKPNPNEAENEFPEGFLSKEFFTDISEMVSKGLKEFGKAEDILLI
jgi:hypothetical protein